MKRYENRIQKLKIEIEELEYKIAKAVNTGRQELAKRLGLMLERENQQLDQDSLKPNPEDVLASIRSSTRSAT